MRCLDRLDMTGLRGAFWPPLHGCHLEPPIVVISSLSRDLFFIFLSVLFSLTPRKGPKEGCYPQGPLHRGMQTGVADDRRLPCLFGIAGHAIFSLTSLLSPSLGKGLTGHAMFCMVYPFNPNNPCSPLLRGPARNGDLSRDDAWYKKL